MNRHLLFWTTTGALIGGLILSILSWTELCSEACNAVHFYRFFGLPLELVGFIFFPVTLLLHFLGRSNIAKLATFILLAVALGSEARFILLQHNEIGNWCPICLSIATTVVIALCPYMMELIKTRSSSMKSTWIFLGTLFTFIGLLLSNYGIAKDQPLLAAEKILQENITFGKGDNSIVVYLFTDWQCPACRKLEPSLAILIPKILEEANLIFVDTVLHVDTLNFMPYNLSFMLNDKDNYLQLRLHLTDISKNTGRPTDDLIVKTITPLSYQQLQYADIAVGSKFFKNLVDQYEITQTPTLVVVNREDLKKRRKLSGREINEHNVQKAIRSVKTPLKPTVKPPKLSTPHVQPPKVSSPKVTPLHVTPTKVTPVQK